MEKTPDFPFTLVAVSACGAFVVINILRALVLQPLGKGHWAVWLFAILPAVFTLATVGWHYNRKPVCECGKPPRRCTCSDTSLVD